MAWPDRPLKQVNGIYVPQGFNVTTDDWEPLQMRNGAYRSELYGPDGNPIGTTSGKLNVRASDAETILANILNKIIPSPATENTLAEVVAALAGVLSVQISGSLPSPANDLRGLASEKPAASAANKGYTYWSVDTGVVEVSTGVAWVVVS